MPKYLDMKRSRKDDSVLCCGVWCGLFLWKIIFVKNNNWFGASSRWRVRDIDVGLCSGDKISG